MSGNLVTVGELITKLSRYPSDMFVLIPERHLRGEEARIEGNYDGPEHVQAVKAWEVRSGFLHPLPEHVCEEDAPTVLILSACDLECITEQLEEEP